MGIRSQVDYVICFNLFLDCRATLRIRRLGFYKRCLSIWNFDCWNLRLPRFLSLVCCKHSSKSSWHRWWWEFRITSSQSRHARWKGLYDGWRYNLKNRRAMWWHWWIQLLLELTDLEGNWRIPWTDQGNHCRRSFPFLYRKRFRIRIPKTIWNERLYIGSLSGNG